MLPKAKLKRFPLRRKSEKSDECFGRRIAAMHHELRGRPASR